MSYNVEHTVSPNCTCTIRYIVVYLQVTCTRDELVYNVSSCDHDPVNKLISMDKSSTLIGVTIYI